MKRIASAFKVTTLVFFFFYLGLMQEGFDVSAGETPSWQVEWKKTVVAANKEGQVTIYAFGGATMLPIESGVFQKRFPKIKVVTVSGSPVQRLLTERRSGKFLGDVVVGGASTPWDLYRAKALDSIKAAMILPEVSDESKWWQGKHRYTDPEGEYGFVVIGTPQTGGIYYNTKLIDPKNFQSFWDFLNPKWKGKIESRDIRSSGTGTANMRVFYYNPKLGPRFIRRLFSEMDITLFRNRRQGVDWLATGKYPICFFCSRSTIGRAQLQGLPIGAFGEMKEGVGLTSSSGNIGLMNKAPHPNAAKVYINWFLSREGQITLQREYSKALVSSSNSLRIDIPKDMVPPKQRLKDDVEYIEADTPERMSMKPILKIFNEALATAAKSRKRLR